MIDTKTALNLPIFFQYCSFSIMLRCGGQCLLALCGSVTVMGHVVRVVSCVGGVVVYWIA